MKRTLKIFSTLLIWGLIVVGLYLAYTWASAYRPIILSIPLRLPDKDLVLIGHGFGNGAGDVELVTTGQAIHGMEVTYWSDSRITVKLPEAVTSGTVRVTRKILIVGIPSNSLSFTSQADGLPSQPYGYTVPVLDDSPWPLFRRDAQNSGHSPLPAVYQGDLPWSFRTGKGIFSTPVIDNRGRVYFGSADHNFYALNPDGSLNWSYTTGEIIDSAAALGRVDPKSSYAPVTFISGDGYMYQFRTGDGFSKAGDRLLWKYQAELRPGISFNRWFEGNVAVGPDGTLYAGNTNFNYYAINPSGTLKWTYSTGSNNWSMAAFGQDGSLYWGSLDTYIRAVSTMGKEKWRKMTLGFVAASAAVGSDGSVYIGSFDSNLYALNPFTGKVLWKFPTLDHIYSSAALGVDSGGNTNAVIFGSADGRVYALRTDGKILWKYDTGDPIRSSPAVGMTTDGQEVVYIGSSNGILYALNAQDGRLRWSFDTTSSEPDLQDRNDLNSSPALGKTGVYIGSESGFLWYIPYEYCLNTTSDPRCRTSQDSYLSNGIDGPALYYVTPGGSTLAKFPETLPASAMITLRLVVTQDGQTANARLCDAPIGCPNDALQVETQPAFSYSLEHSADGRFIFIRPDTFLAPGESYTLRVTGNYYDGGLRIGNLTLGGRRQGRFDQSFVFKVPPEGSAKFPLSVSASQTSAFEWTRLAAVLPTMLPSLNQIGFDSMDWIMGTVTVTLPGPKDDGRFILWAVGAKHAKDGSLVPDPTSDYTLPLSGSYQAEDFIASNRGFKMNITGIGIPFNLFELRGRFGKGLSLDPGASAYADTDALSIPKFGPYLVAAGLANNWYQRLLVSGTYLTRPYAAAGEANQAPPGVTLARLDYELPASSTDGSITAVFKLDPETIYLAREHRPGILLVDMDKMEAVPLDYLANLSTQADADGSLKSVTLHVPRDTPLPKALRAFVMLDVFPLAQKELR